MLALGKVDTVVKISVATQTDRQPVEPIGDPARQPAMDSTYAMKHVLLRGDNRNKALGHFASRGFSATSELFKSCQSGVSSN